MAKNIEITFKTTIVNTTNVAQLDDSLAAMDLELLEEILRKCDAVHNNIRYSMS